MPTTSLPRIARIQTDCSGRATMNARDDRLNLYRTEGNIGKPTFGMRRLRQRHHWPDIRARPEQRQPETRARRLKPFRRRPQRNPDVAFLLHCTYRVRRRGSQPRYSQKLHSHQPPIIDYRNHIAPARLIGYLRFEETTAVEAEVAAQGNTQGMNDLVSKAAAASVLEHSRERVAE